MKYFLKLSFLLFFSVGFTQNQYSVANIPSELTKDVNAVIRDQTTKIILKDYNDVIISRKEVITAFNRTGLKNISPVAFYDKSSSIKSINAVLFDSNGKVIRKFKKRDFVDVSASGSNLYTDNRMLVLDFTPKKYPFTFEMNVEIRSSSTAFLPPWNPSPEYDVSTQYSSYEIINEKQIPITTRKFNLEDFNVTF